MKIGIVQTRGLGDVVIAVPLAMWYADRGCEVLWPIDSEFIPSFAFAFPKITFVPVDKAVHGNNSAAYFMEYPRAILSHLGCDKQFVLYSNLSGYDLGNSRIRASFGFDRYKYAVGGVPFSEKWKFLPRRNPLREADLFRSLNLKPGDEYVLLHEEGSNFKFDVLTVAPGLAGKRIIRIAPLTDNVFDWLGVLEHASQAFLIDSVYANIVDQMGLIADKSLILRSLIGDTPIFQSNWKYM
jgi:hypothetical protein